MLINLRNALMAGKRLPYDAEVEYIGSTGTQWIDTGVKKTSAMTIDCTFSLSATSTKAIFGARTSASALDRFMLMSIGTYFRFDARYQPRLGTPDTTSMFRFQYDGENATITNLTTGTTSTSSAPVGDAGVLDISLFGVNTNGVVVSLMLGRMYAFKIWDNGTLVRDFIPVRKGAVGYLYDRVTGALFGNAGSGDFVLGPDVVPVEYIESHGTEWIDTGYALNSATDIIEMDYMVVGPITSTYMWTMGSLESGKSYGISVNDVQSRFTFIKTKSNVAQDAQTTTRHKLEIDNRGVINDGVIQQETSGTGINGTWSNCLFALRVQLQSGASSGVSYCSKARVYVYRHKRNGVLIRSFLPVRVGSGSTWEGAMMDVLTRRVYRNAGTGAFGYGNDLKYPIPAS